MRQKQPLEGSGGNGGTRAAGQCKGQAMDPNGTNKLSGLSPLPPPPRTCIKVGTSVPLAVGETMYQTNTNNTLCPH